MFNLPKMLRFSLAIYFLTFVSIHFKIVIEQNKIQGGFSLNSIDKVKSFVNDISKFDSDFDLVSGRYVIDAKSIMGIFSLDLSKPITLNIHADNANLDTIMEVLSAYTV